MMSFSNYLAPLPPIVILATSTEAITEQRGVFEI